MSLSRAGSVRFTSRFPGTSTGNFLEMKGSGTIVVGSKDGASVGNGDPAVKKNNLLPVSWRDKAWCYVS